MKQKSNFLEKINKMEKPARLTKIKREMIQITKSRNETDAISTDPVARTRPLSQAGPGLSHSSLDHG